MSEKKNPKLAFDLLIKDHRKVAELFKQIDKASEEENWSEAWDNFQEVNEELTNHTEIEETIFYPALEKVEKTKDLVKTSYKDHAKVKEQLKEISELGHKDNEKFLKLFKELRKDVEAHIKDEEEDLFPKTEEALEHEKLLKLGEDIQQMKEEMTGRSKRLLQEAEAHKEEDAKVSERAAA